MPPPPETIDRALELMKAAFIGILSDSAADANISGQVRAAKQLGIGLDFRLISTRAVAATLQYRRILEEQGGTMITEVTETGKAIRVFKPWLNDAIESDKEQIGAIIENGVREGTPLKQVEQALDEVFAMREHNAKLTAYQETKALYNDGTMQRFREEDIEEGRWKHMDPQPNPRVEHQTLDGQVFRLTDSVWNEMDLPNCHCYCEPVIPGRDEGE